MINQESNKNPSLDKPIPWKEYLFKNCVNIRNGKDYKDIETSEGIPVIGSGGQFAYCSQIMYDGEVVFLGRKGTIDRPLYYNGPFWAVDTMFYAIPNRGFSGKFLYYLATCFPYKAISTQTALPSMTQTALKGQIVYIPDYAEQQCIVDYLDDKTKAIDARISVLEKKSDAYTRLKASVINRAVTRGLNPNVTLKDSGIDWIGMIPEHWENRQLKNCVTIQNGRDYKALEVSNGVPVIGSGGQFAYASTYMHDGEVLFMGRKGTIDKPLYFNGKFWAVDTIFYAIPKNNMHGKYLYYYALCFPFGKIMTQTALPSMTQTALNNIKLYIPPLSEQQSIASYLDTKCSEIDKAIDNLCKQIEALKRLKRSLINEVVIGKRKV